jgi:hypothetical protein
VTVEAGIEELEATRLVTRYMWIARGALGVALAGAIGFLFVVRTSVFAPDTTNWPLIACVGSWAAGMAVAVWARGRIRATGRRRV